MITTRCPFCGNEIRIPDSILGKKVRCKSTSCQQVFTAAEAEPPVVAAPPPQRSPQAYEPAPAPDSLPDWNNFDEPTAAAPLQRLRHVGSGENGSAGQTNQNHSQGNYPNLLRYLGWARLSALVQLILLLMIASFLLIGALIMPFTSDRDATGPVVIGILTGVLLAAVAYSLYVLTMAVIEFIHVIVDIEANTRRIADSGE